MVLSIVRLTDFSVLSFDCYGTLIDWESGILAALQPLVARADNQDLAAETILETFARHEASQESETPAMLYSELLERVHDGIAAEWGLTPLPEESSAFGASVPLWPAFPDSAQALRYLKQHYWLVILSNVDRQSFVGSNTRLGVEFDFIFTAEDIGSYKPDLRNFQYLITQLTQHGVAKSSILHTAQSLFHDHVPANQVGLASAWINRRSERSGPGATPVTPARPHVDFEFATMGAMAERHMLESKGE